MVVPEVGGIILGFPDARFDPVEARAPRGRNTNRVVDFGERQHENRRGWAEWGAGSGEIKISGAIEAEQLCDLERV